jgi:hypothetical protein
LVYSNYLRKDFEPFFNVDLYSVNIGWHNYRHAAPPDLFEHEPSPSTSPPALPSSLGGDHRGPAPSCAPADCYPGGQLWVLGRCSRRASSGTAPVLARYFSQNSGLLLLPERVMWEPGKTQPLHLRHRHHSAPPLVDPPAEMRVIGPALRQSPCSTLYPTSLDSCASQATGEYALYHCGLS